MGFFNKSSKIKYFEIKLAGYVEPLLQIQYANFNQEKVTNEKIRYI